MSELLEKFNQSEDVDDEEETKKKQQEKEKAKYLDNQFWHDNATLES